ncbi:MAG TPA: Wzz/FepE/Etk N-terminal domain-containing protein [Aggregatilineales bacterium]|nr:Wzz/FepE/Etk N-terminal domain-containing protein [Aggregatilineales bacterium]
MQLQQYMRILWRRGWIMLLLAVLTAAAAFGFSQIIKERAPLYKSTVTILVKPARTDFGQAQAAKALLGQYQSWLESSYRAQDVIESLQLDMVPRELLGDVFVAGDLNQLTLRIEVENPNGDLANRVAWEWANRFIQWRDEENAGVRREDRIDAEILDDPVYALERPKTAINTIAGGILGLLVGLAIVFVLEYAEAGIIKTPDDVDRVLAMPVLSAIPPTEQ